MVCCLWRLDSGWSHRIGHVGKVAVNNITIPVGAVELSRIIATHPCRVIRSLNIAFFTKRIVHVTHGCVAVNVFADDAINTTCLTTNTFASLLEQLVGSSLFTPFVRQPERLACLFRPFAEQLLELRFQHGAGEHPVWVTLLVHRTDNLVGDSFCTLQPTTNLRQLAGFQVLQHQVTQFAVGVVLCCQNQL